MDLFTDMGVSLMGWTASDDRDGHSLPSVPSFPAGVPAGERTAFYDRPASTNRETSVSVIAEFRLSGPGVALSRALSETPETTLELERSVGAGEVIVATVWATGGDLDAFEAGMETDPTARSYEVLERRSGERLYRIEIPFDSGPNLAPLERETGGSRLSFRVTAEGSERRMRFPDAASMSAFFEGARDHGLSVTLFRVYNDAESPQNDRYGLTEKQHEAMLRAADEGYFEVPRRTDLSTLAAKLGVSRQAISERLRRGTGILIRNVLDRSETEE